MTPEDFRNIAQGTQAFLVGMAVVVGGAWAGFRFWRLGTVKKSEEDIEKVRLEKRKLQTDLDKLRQELATTVKGEVVLNVERFGDPNYGEAYLNIDFTISNTGNRAEYIDFAKTTIAVAPVTCGNDGAIKLGTVSEGKLLGILVDNFAWTLFPAESVSKACLVPITVPAVYMIEVVVLLLDASAMKVVADALATGDGGIDAERQYDGQMLGVTRFFDARTACSSPSSEKEVESRL